MRCWEGLDAMAACACVDIIYIYYTHYIYMFYISIRIRTYSYVCKWLYRILYVHCISTSHLYCCNAVLFDVLLALDPKMRLYSPLYVCKNSNNSKNSHSNFLCRLQWSMPQNCFRFLFKKGSNNNTNNNNNNNKTKDLKGLRIKDNKNYKCSYKQWFTTSLRPFNNPLWPGGVSALVPPKSRS